MKQLLTVFLIAYSFVLLAQDTHFTQFYAAPLTLNPALTGVFDGKYRFSLIYRDQWRRVLDSPYQTFAAGLDLRFPINIRGKRQKDAAAVGLMFYNDRVPSVDFSTNQIALSGAFHKSLNKDNSQFLSGGIQIGIAQRNVGYENLSFQDQFDGTSGYNDPTSEVLPSNNFTYADYAVGINYSYAPRRGIALFMGAALYHILEPQASFFYDRTGELTDPEEFGNSRLFRKYAFQLSARLPINDKIDLLPRAIAAFQGPHAEINVGTNLRFGLGEFNSTALHIGTWVRPVTNKNNTFTLDAVVLMAGFELNNFLLGFSYDATLNDLTTNRQGQGAFEISIAYLGEYENETILCPKF